MGFLFKSIIDTLKAECIYDKGLKEKVLSAGSPVQLPGCHVFCYYNAGVMTVMIYITQEKSHGYTSTGGNFKMRRKYENPALSYCKVVILSTFWQYFISFTIFQLHNAKGKCVHPRVKQYGFRVQLSNGQNLKSTSQVAGWRCCEDACEG